MMETLRISLNSRRCSWNLDKGQPDPAFREQAETEVSSLLVHGSMPMRAPVRTATITRFPRIFGASHIVLVLERRDRLDEPTAGHPHQAQAR
ncbi:MAG: hypothetical protein R2849_10135 [Thermomicrobiales bacterium]